MESRELLMYLLQVITTQGVFFLLYYLFLRNKTTYVMNRAYLLSTLVISFTIPFMELPISPESIPVEIADTEVFNWHETVIAADKEVFASDPEVVSADTVADYWLLAKWGYVILAAALMIRSIFHLIILQKLKKESLYVEKKWFKLFKTAQVHPFSFLTNVFIPNRIFGTDSFDQILEHECEHVRQYHSIDRLLVDFMAALLWFNPFMYLYRRALIEIHEYQADAAVIKKFPDPIGYQEVLFSQLKATPYSGLVSHFNFSTIKKRIVMINKQKNRKSMWAYLLAAPVTFFVIVAFANKTVERPDVDTNGKSEQVESTVSERPIEVFESKKTKVSPKSARVTVSVQNDYLPSILPLKETREMKVTSDFGMRIDPIDKKRKMHKGLDLGTPIGTTVISTAEGIVHQAGFDDKYGYYIMIEHEDKYMTRYSQLSELMVKKGDKVRRSQEIGLSGNSGRSTGPHLHYEVIEVGVGHQNPRDYIKNHTLTTTSLILKPSNSEKKEAIAIIKLRMTEEEEAARMEEAQHQEMLALDHQTNALEMQREVATLAAQEKELVEIQLSAIEKERELDEMKVITSQRQKELAELEAVSIHKQRELAKIQALEAALELEKNRATIEKKKGNAQKQKSKKDKAKKKVKSEQSKQKLSEANTLVDIKKFVLNASFLHGRQGERVVVFSDNYMLIEDDKFIFQTALPNEVGFNGLGGVTAKGSITSYEVKRNKRNGSIMVLAEVSTNRFGQGTITFNIDGLGHESATLVNTRGQMITMLGSIESIENAGIYQGRSSF
ncbi:MAG: peptidoglycan DD-metalloendopeptidase family protein [Cyclobacteriaceae bacterium]